MSQPIDHPLLSSETIDPQEYSSFMATYQRIGEIATARNLTLARIGRLERSLKSGYQGDYNRERASFDYIDPADGSARMTYCAYEAVDNERYDIPASDLTDPGFDERSAARMAELQAQIDEREAQAAFSAAAKAEADLAAERELYEALRLKYGGGPTQP